MASNPLNSGNLEHLALKGLMFIHMMCQHQQLGISWHFCIRNMDISHTTGLRSIHAISDNGASAHQALKLSTAARSNVTSTGLELQDVHATRGFSKLLVGTLLSLRQR